MSNQVTFHWLQFSSYDAAVAKPDCHLCAMPLQEGDKICFVVAERDIDLERLSIKVMLAHITCPEPDRRG